MLEDPLENAAVWILAWKEVLNLRFRALLTFLGLVIGTFALTTMGSMALHFHRMSARFETYVKGKMFIRERSGFFGAGALSEEEISSLKKRTEVADAIPVLVSRLRTHEFIVFGLPQVALGLPLEKIPTLFADVALVKGHWPRSPEECALGSDIAEELGGTSPSSFSYQGKAFRVSGIMARTNGPEDSEMIVSLPVLESLLGRNGLVSYGIVLLQPNQDPDSFGRLISSQHAHWDVLPPSFLSVEARKSEKLWDALTVGTGMIAAFVGGMGILTIMMMGVQERIPEIAIAKALGASRVQIFSLFIFESFIFSTLGSLAGFFVSLFFVREANQYLARQGMVLFEPSGWLLGLNFLAAVFLAFLGGLYPAYYGSRIKPAEALRR